MGALRGRRPNLTANSSWRPFSHLPSTMEAGGDLPPRAPPATLECNLNGDAEGLHETRGLGHMDSLHLSHSRGGRRKGEADASTEVGSPREPPVPAQASEAPRPPGRPRGGVRGAPTRRRGKARQAGPGASADSWQGRAVNARRSRRRRLALRSQTFSLRSPSACLRLVSGVPLQQPGIAIEINRLRKVGAPGTLCNW